MGGIMTQRMGVFNAAAGAPPWSGPPGLIGFEQASVSGTNALGLAYPAGFAANDIAILHALIQDFNSAGNIDTPSGWNAITENGLGGLTSQRHAAFWRRLTGSESGTINITGTSAGFGDSGSDTKAGVMSIWRGCVASGTPYEDLDSNTGTSANITGSAVTTTGADRTVLNLCGHGDDDLSAPSAGGWVEDYDYVNAAFTIDFGLKCYSLEQATAATVSAATHVAAASDRWATISFALVPA